jgi:hypothetical protein
MTVCARNMEARGSADQEIKGLPYLPCCRLFAEYYRGATHGYDRALRGQYLIVARTQGRDSPQTICRIDWAAISARTKTRSVM